MADTQVPRAWGPPAPPTKPAVDGLDSRNQNLISLGWTDSVSPKCKGLDDKPLGEGWREARARAARPRAAAGGLGGCILGAHPGGAGGGQGVGRCVLGSRWGLGGHILGVQVGVRGWGCVLGHRWGSGGCVLGAQVGVGGCILGAQVGVGRGASWGHRWGSGGWGARPGEQGPGSRTGQRAGHQQLLTQGQPHQAEWEEAGGEEGGPQRHVQLLGGLGLDPHEQAGGRGQAQSAWEDPGRAGPGRTTYFLIFSRMSAILPKRFCVKMELRSRQRPQGCTATLETPRGAQRPRPEEPRGPVLLPSHAQAQAR